MPYIMALFLLAKYFLLIRYKWDKIHKELFSITVRPVIIVETPVVSGRIGQDEPVVLECLIEAYPKGIHFWEHVRGKNSIFIRLSNGEVFLFIPRNKIIKILIEFFMY